MKTILKRIFLTVTVVLLLCCSAVPCFATAQSGKITIVLEDNDKNKINGMTVNICQVATLDSVGYYPAHGFENSGISIAGILNNPDSTVAASVVDYIKEKNISGYEFVSAVNLDGVEVSENNGITQGTIVLTNKATSYELPATGGSGTKMYVIGGLLLTLLASIGLLYKRNIAK